MNAQKRNRAFGLYLAAIAVLALLWILRDSSSGFGQNGLYTYAQFEQDLKSENVVSVVVSQNREVPSGQADVTLKGDSGKGGGKVLYVSDINTLQETMKSYDFADYVVKEMPEENWLISILPTLILFAVLFVFYIMMTNHASAASGGGSKMMNFGKSRAKMTTDENKKVTFGSVAGLKEEKEELEELRMKAEAEKDKVSGMVNETASAITKYGNQISSAEKKALEYEAEIRKKEEDLEYLKKKLAEEIAMSQAAASGTWRDISEVSFAEGDRRLLANLIYCEAGGEPYAGQVAVGSVVINRVLSSKFPDTVVGVIYQSGQFSPVASGRLDIALASDKATESCYRAADEAMAGVTNVGTCVFFRTPIEGLSGINIGGHVFY